MLYLLPPLAGSLPVHSRCSRPLLSPCALVCSRGSGRHSTGGSDIRQKYGWKYAALWTCPEGSVFPAVFLRTAALQYTAVGQRPRAHVPCEQGPVRQGRYPLLLPQRAVLWPPDLVVRLRRVGSVARWLPIVFTLQKTVDSQLCTKRYLGRKQTFTE